MYMRKFKSIITTARHATPHYEDEKGEGEEGND
jgi:hypothetical protein